MAHINSRRDFLSAGSLGFLGLTLSDYLQAAAVPEPATSALLIAGLACGAAVVRRRGICA